MKGRVFAAFWLLWSLAAVGIAFCTIVHVSAAAIYWWPWPGQVPIGRTASELSAQLVVAVLASALGLLLAFPSVWQSIRFIVWPRMASLKSLSAMLGAIAAGLSPVPALLLLPGDDPYTGDGIPIAWAMSVLMLGVALAVIHSVPGMVIFCISGLEYRNRQMQTRIGRGAPSPQ